MAYAVTTDHAGFTITGTVLAREVVWVFISVQDLRGKVLAWRSLSVEDPDGGIRPNRTPAFVSQIDVPARTGFGALIIEVNAYNSLGRGIGSVRTIAGGPTRVVSLRTALTR